MNRRKFLKLSSLAIAVAGLPLLGNTKAVAKESDPKTVQELIDAMEARFVCSTGYPGPYVYKDCQEDRFGYTTYQLMTYKSNPVAEQKLVQSLWATFRQYPEGARMYWRLDYKINLEEFEQWDDQYNQTGDRMVKIRTRLVFPDYYKGISYDKVL